MDYGFKKHFINEKQVLCLKMCNCRKCSNNETWTFANVSKSVHFLLFERYIHKLSLGVSYFP